MTRSPQSLPHQLCQCGNKFWRIVQTGTHFKLGDAQPPRLFASLMIDFAKSLDVIGDKRYRHDAHFVPLLAPQDRAARGAGKAAATCWRRLCSGNRAGDDCAIARDPSGVRTVSSICRW